MKIVIVGDGKVGNTLAAQLSLENHDITLIDNNPNAIEYSMKGLDVIGVQGNGANYHTQMEAGVQDADLMIAVTSGDEVNMICCLIARKLGAKHTIARIRNPEYSGQFSFFKEDFGLSMTVNPEKASAHEIARIIHFPFAISIKGLVKDRVELVESRIMPDSALCGKPVREIHEKYKLNILLCLVERKEKLFIPAAGEVLQAGDKIHVTGSLSDIDELAKLAGHQNREPHTVMIIGGGRISYYLAKELLNTGLKVKIIEQNKNRCRQLCELLPKALVINGDGTQQGLLDEESLSSTDVLVALTGIDEENIVVSMFAARRGVQRVIAKINRAEYKSIAEDAGIDSVISPVLITAYQIIQYVRAKQNTIGSKVNSLVRIANERAEVLEFIVAKNTMHQGEPLSKITFRQDIVVAAIVHKNKLIVPHGDASFTKGDSVIIVSMDHKFTEMNDIFKSNIGDEIKHMEGRE